MMAELYQIDGGAFLSLTERGVSILVIGLAGGDYAPSPELDAVTERIGEFHAVSCSARFGGVCCCHEWRKP